MGLVGLAFVLDLGSPRLNAEAVTWALVVFCADRHAFFSELGMLLFEWWILGAVVRAIMVMLLSALSPPVHTFF